MNAPRLVKTRSGERYHVVIDDCRAGIVEPSLYGLEPRWQAWKRTGPGCSDYQFAGVHLDRDRAVQSVK